MQGWGPRRAAERSGQLCPGCGAHVWWRVTCFCGISGCHLGTGALASSKKPGSAVGDGAMPGSGPRAPDAVRRRVRHAQLGIILKQKTQHHVGKADATRDSTQTRPYPAEAEMVPSLGL